jgi:hypothetical protein
VKIATKEEGILVSFRALKIVHNEPIVLHAVVVIELILEKSLGVRFEASTVNKMRSLAC